MKIDLIYIQGEMFTTFLVNSNEGLNAYKEIIRVCGFPKVFNMHLKQTLAQLRKSGYRVRKSTAKRSPANEIFNKRDKLLLDQLTA